MFSILAQNWRRGWQNFEKKTGEALAETVVSLEILSPSEPILEPKLKTWSRQIMFYVKYPEAMEILKMLETFEK